MIWILWILAAFVVISLIGRYIDKSSRAIARRQMAAEDPEGYRLVLEYEESQKPENKARAAALLAQQRREAKSLLTAELVPVRDVPILLKSDEIAYWSERCRFYEEGSLPDISIRRAMVEVDSGPLVLTNKRVVFVGAKRTIDIPLSRIVAIQQLDGSMNISVANGKTRHFETGNPRAEIIASRLAEGHSGPRPAKTNSSELSVAANVVSINLNLSFDGPGDLIKKTLQDLGTLLQAEVDTCASDCELSIVGMPVDSATYLSNLSKQFHVLADLSRESEEAFEASSGPRGSPSALRDAYGHLLRGLLTVRRAILSAEAPPKLAQTEAEYESYVNSFYKQVTSWPGQIQMAAADVTADHCNLNVSMSYDIAPLERVLAVETR